MAASQNPQKKEQSSTYVVQDQKNQEELRRLTLQSHLLTTSMGGPLSDLPHPTAFRRVLDVGSGSGSWVIETAQMYPTLELLGIDRSERMVEHAREAAHVNQVSDRVTFQVMDALLRLEFPDAFFDLVNLRLGLSFLRTGDWPKLLSEMLRVTSPGGVIRITDTEIIQPSTSPALRQLNEMSQCAFFKAGHLFTQETTGLTAHLAPLLEQHGCQQVQTKTHTLEYQAGTEEGQMFYEDMKNVFHLIRPFYQKWGCTPENYHVIYQQALDEMLHPEFRVTWNLLSAWGTKPLGSTQGKMLKL